MTLQEFARDLIDSAEWRESVKARCHAGTLPPDLELMLFEMADGRVPMSADRPVVAAAQSRTLALIRPSARKEEVMP
jgi:hypothetical protein